VLFFALLFFGRAQAILAPQVYLEDLKIDNNTYKAGATITGTATIENDEDSYQNDLLFQYQLLSKEVDGVPTEVIDQRTGSDKIELAAGAKEEKPFSYTLPANLPNGNSVFRLQLVNSLGEEMGWSDKVINIGGEGTFLTLDNAWIVKDNTQQAAGGGVYYNPGETPNIRFTINNDSGFTISAYPRITTYLRNPGAEIIDKTVENALVIDSGAHQTANYTLAKITNPETYISEVKLYDGKTGLPVSNSVFFRWIISGPGAQVLGTDTDKNFYQAGETAKVTVAYNGPADYKIDGGKGVVESKIVSSDGTIAGQASQEVALSPGKVTINVPVSSNVNGFKVVSDITQGSKSLSQYQVQVGPNNKIALPETGQKTAQVNWGDYELATIIGAVCLIIGAMVAYLIKKRK